MHEKAKEKTKQKQTKKKQDKENIGIWHWVEIPVGWFVCNAKALSR